MLTPGAWRRYVPGLTTFRLAVLIAGVFFVLILLKEFRGYDYGLIDLMENKVLDLKFKSRGRVGHSNRVAIAAVDERSLERFGRWPWPRDRVAELLKKCYAAGARVVAFDVIFADRVDDPVRDRLAELAAGWKATGGRAARPFAVAAEALVAAADPDARLARVIGDTTDRTVLGFFFLSDADMGQGLDPARLAADVQSVSISRLQPDDFVAVTPDPPPPPVRRSPGLRAPLPAFCENTEYFGHFSFTPDEDGTMRWAEIIHGLESEPGAPPAVFPSLALKAAGVYLGGMNHRIFVNVFDAGVHSVSLRWRDEAGNDAAREIVTDQQGRMLVNYRGPAMTFPHVSAADILDGTVGDALKDKLVIVGATATAVYDLRATPFGEVYPGVEIHANVAESILSGAFMARPWWAWLYELGVAALFGLLFGYVTSRWRAVNAAGFILLVIALFGAVDRLLIFRDGQAVRSVLLFVEAFAIFLFVYVYRYITEEAEKRFIRGAFGRYLSPKVVEQIVDDPDRLRLGGEKREMTFLFSDLANFTGISEGMTPETLSRVLNEYLTPMTEIVLKNEGLLDKYIGDAVMAVYGAPLDQPDHAKRACETAVAMLETVEAMRPRWQSYGLTEFFCRIGVNTGYASAGNMGSEQRFDYTVIGDAVNLAARMEPQNKEYDTLCCITEFTAVRVADAFVLRELDAVRVKGKKEPIKVYELIGRGRPTAEQAEWIGAFEAALAAYRAQAWDAAAEGFARTIALRPDGDAPSKRFLKRIDKLRAAPPEPDWDGVWTMTTK